MDASRASTPGPSWMTDSRLSLDTIGELTTTLADHLRASPEPLLSLSCCCGNNECENLDSWRSTKAKLESRLVLSAEVGQALLHRHESLIRDSERSLRPAISRTGSESMGDLAQARSENAETEKRLNRALIHSEMLEEGQRLVMKELESAQETINRLNVQHARSIGVEAKLSASERRNDDLQAEIVSEIRMRRVAESRIALLTEHSNRLQSELRRIRDNWEHRRFDRTELSESILKDARSKIKSLKHQHGSTNVSADQLDSGIQSILESLFSDNEALHQGNNELQTLLADARETAKTLQEEIDESRANVDNNATMVMASLALESQIGRSDGISEGATHHTVSNLLNPFPTSLSNNTNDQIPPKHTGSKDVASSPQTDVASVSTNAEASTTRTQDFPPTSTSYSSSPIKHMQSLPSHPESDGRFGTPSDLRSESSSEAVSTLISTFLERIVALLNRMTQSDALTLTNRLKRQNLKGADIGHVSKSTVQGIMRDVQALRTQFPALNDEKASATCTRKDLRVLFKLFKDVFEEMGNTRITLNSIILDPSIAARVSEGILDPAKALTREREAAAKSSSWISPISKLFGATTSTVTLPRGEIKPDNFLATKPSEQSSRPTLRPMAKLQPALAASTTTVNVEFSGSGVGRSTSTSVVPVVQSRASSATLTASSPTEYSNQMSAPRSMMTLWAGAPRITATKPVLLPSFARHGQGRRPQAEIVRTRRLSRVVDAIVDVTNPTDGMVDGEDVLGPLLHRPLRRRGLSDSSIHSTYTSYGDDNEVHTIEQSVKGEKATEAQKSTNAFLSVDHTLHSLRPIGQLNDSHWNARTSPLRQSSSAGHSDLTVPSTPEHRQQTSNRSASSAISFLPILSGWGIEDEITSDRSAKGSSLREDSALSRWGRDI